MSDTSGRRFTLSAERRALLERMMSSEGLAAAAERAIPRRADGGPAPLSPAQQRLWFLDRLYPGSAAYNIATALRLEGPLDVDALRRAFGTIVERHEVLRSVFEEYEGEPRQRVQPAAPVDLPLVDLSAEPEGERERLAMEAARAEAGRPFDLRAGPLLRALLVRLAPASHLLVVNMHHVASDGWSVGVLARELGRAYGAHLRGETPELPELPVQYADFADWQRRRLEGGGLAAGLGYWRGHLADVQPLALPTDRPRPAAPAFRGGTLRVELPGALADAAGELARAEGTTPFAVLLAAFKALLRRDTGEDEVTVGTPTAGRDRVETEGLIGFFANTLALRTRVSVAASFRDLVREVRATVSGGFAHAEVPFERVVAAVRPDRDAATPLFQVMFALQNATSEAMGAERFALPGVRTALVPLESGTSKFDLSLFLHRAGGSLAAAWEYDSELFDAATVERMAGRFARLLESALASPDVPLGALALMPAAEREGVVARCSGARAELPADPAVHRLFEAQAARTPDAPALVDGGRTLTYAELDARAGRLARRLRAEGVGPEDRVGLLLERSAGAVVALLAALKAGAAYVPLDPAYPRERLRFMAGDAGLAVLVARAGAAEELGLDVRVLAPEAGDAGEDADAPAARVDGANAAYVIYTSGSTGRPNGTVMGHTALTNLVLWQNAASRPGMRTLQFTPLSFDVSFQEILATLGSGGTLVMVADETRRDPEALLRVLAEERIERLFLPFVALQQLAEAAERGAVFPEALEEVVTAGEQLTATPALRAFFARSRARLHNHYGPTESHVVTAHALPADPAGWSALPPIGAALPNVRALVLDEGLEPVPVGVPGELYLGGAALARGYLDRPGATAGKWLPDPVSGEPGARLYRTGDRARLRPDGELEYLGRADFQLKVRGFRVEPGEVEAVLREHPAVRQAAVRVVGRESADRRLVAYVVRDAAGAPAAEIRAWLRDRLPAYMVPAALVELEAMPLTPSGKVDARSLPDPEETAGDAAAPVAPRDPVEEVVAGIWAALLGRDRVGVHENFFDAGGHSLLVTRVLSRVERAFGVALPVRELFAHPTVAGLALRIRGALESGEAEAPAADRAIPRLPAGAAAPLSFAQQRLWFVHQLEGGGASNNLSTGLRLAGSLSAETLRRALEMVVARHDVLRTRFEEEGAGIVQRVDAPLPFELPVHDLAGSPAGEREAEVSRMAAAEAAEPFDLRRPPLVRARLLRTGEAEHVLLLTLHHIAADGWSVAVFTRDLRAAYEAALAGGEPALPPLPVQYADFAAWQRERLAGEALEAKLSAWKARLAGAPAALDLPTDRPRPPVHSFRGAAFTFTVEPGLAAGLRALARREDATLFMVLLAGWFGLLHRYTGQDDLVVGSPSANRDRPELEELIGCFINVLPVRVRVRPEAGFSELLRGVRGAVLDAFGGRDVSFDQIVDALGVPRDPGRPPLVQVLFALQNTPAERFALPGVEAAPLGGESASARYDLSVYMREDAAGVLTGSVEFATDLFDRSTMERWTGHFRNLLVAVAADPAAPLADAALLGGDELDTVLHGWNDTAAETDPAATVPALFAAQARRTPDAVALVAGDERLTYAELDRRANRLAHHLRALGVGPEGRVGILLDRSPEMVAAMLAVLKAGGAYLPLDPAYPAERLRFMTEDAGVAAVITGAAHAVRLPRLAAPLVVPDRDAAAIAALPDTDPAVEIDPECAAYVIYTSGSTGTPKGVVVQHRNAVNFFAAMRERAGGETGAWLAVTSISFDISVLELLYTLCHGARVVLHDGVEAAPRQAAPAATRKVDFSLFYFASSDTAGSGKYRLLLEGARFADRNGFSAVWTPERHFHAFGGVFPSPAVTSAAIAPVTENIRIRAGSVVLPLHDTLRVAEEWSVVDNLSDGRVEISFASGWHANDFVLAPGSYDARRELMFEGIEEVRHLWRGGRVTRPNGKGQPVEVGTLPRPVQPELPVWVTAGGSPDTFRRAGQSGAHLLTHLLGQSVEELADKVRAYREARREAGHDPETGRVALMLHTYVADDMERVRETVRGPFREYLRTSFDLVLQLARGLGLTDASGNIAPEDVEAMLDVAFDRYFATSGLMGTPEHCLEMVERLAAIGVDEVACLIDFGVEEGAVLEGLEALNRVRMAAGARRAPRRSVSVAAEILAQGATHLQCTPSLATLLAADAEALPALARLECILLGGEALPAALAAQLRAHSPARLLNMYGPTETTVWSATHEVDGAAGPVPIGRPVANTQLYVVDGGMRPVPPGVAGELLIGGAGVTRGYHARPDLTAGRFVPDPFGREPGGRLYRTGDLARFRADGVLEFLGRLDQQVKVRGHRIEPGEVEAALDAHPAIRESVVVAHDAGAGERLLVAYLVPEAAGTPGLASPLSPEEADRVLGDLPRYSLPGGMTVAHQQDFVTGALYREVFEQNVYLRNGIVLEDGARVVDVGSNIGMFTLFAHASARGVKSWSFEPIPDTFRVLEANTRLFGLDARVFNAGVAEKSGEATFTFYPNSSGLSGRYADVERDRRVTRSVIESWMTRAEGGANAELARHFTPGDVDSLLDERFRAVTFQCPLRTLSDLIREEGIERIDLLKVDAEKSEYDVLCGIEDEHWPRVRQVSMEVDTEDLLARVVALLDRHGFEHVVERLVTVRGEDEVGAGEYVYMLYAKRPGEAVPLRQPDAPIGEAARTPVPPAGALRRWLAERLPEYMVPSHFVTLDRIPLTPNGKTDRRALPDPVPGARAALEVEYVSPRNELEEAIAGVWREVLGVERAGVEDNFFELGGTSLRLAAVHRLLAERTGREVTIVDLFRYPTIGSLAEHLGGAEDRSGHTIQQVQDRAERQRQARGARHRARARG